MTRKLRPRGAALVAVKAVKKEEHSREQALLKAAVMVTGDAAHADAFIEGKYPEKTSPLTFPQMMAAGGLLLRAEETVRRLPPRPGGYLRTWFTAMSRRPATGDLGIGWAVGDHQMMIVSVQPTGAFAWIDPETGTEHRGQDLPETVWAEIDMLLLTGRDGEADRKGLTTVGGPPLPDERAEDKRTE